MIKQLKINIKKRQQLKTKQMIDKHTDTYKIINMMIIWKQISPKGYINDIVEFRSE